jgi:hypothetical protein
MSTITSSSVAPCSHSELSYLHLDSQSMRTRLFTTYGIRDRDRAIARKFWWVGFLFLTGLQVVFPLPYAFGLAVLLGAIWNGWLWWSRDRFFLEEVDGKFTARVERRGAVIYTVESPFETCSGRFQTIVPGDFSLHYQCVLFITAAGTPSLALFEPVIDLYGSDFQELFDPAMSVPSITVRAGSLSKLVSVLKDYRPGHA